MKISRPERESDFSFNKTTRKYLKKLNDRILPTVYDMMDAFTDECEKDGVAVEKVLEKEGVKNYNEFVYFMIAANLARKRGLIYDRNI